MNLSRRSFLTGTGGTAAALVVGAGCSDPLNSASASVSPASRTVSFDGAHQAGITTPTQQRLLFIAFDVIDGSSKADLAGLLQSWTTMARRVTAGQTAGNTAPANAAARLPPCFPALARPAAVGGGPCIESSAILIPINAVPDRGCKLTAHLRGWGRGTRHEDRPRCGRPGRTCAA
jgi:hypothetical protein